jgi:hypothetical protein
MDRSHSACRRKAGKVESESMHVLHAVVSFSIFRKEKTVLHVLTSLRQRIALCFHALFDGSFSWMKPLAFGEDASDLEAGTLHCAAQRAATALAAS